MALAQRRRATISGWSKKRTDVRQETIQQAGRVESPQEDFHSTYLGRFSETGAAIVLLSAL